MKRCKGIRCSKVRHGTARYVHQWPSGTDLLPSFPLFSHLRVVQTLSAHNQPYLCPRVYTRRSARPCVLRSTANLSPFECKAWIFPAALFAGINSPYFEPDIRLLAGEWFSRDSYESLDAFNFTRLPDKTSVEDSFLTSEQTFLLAFKHFLFLAFSSFNADDNSEATRKHGHPRFLAICTQNETKKKSTMRQQYSIQSRSRKVPSKGSANEW